MWASLFLALSLCGAVPAAEIETITGEHLVGAVRELSDDSLVYQSGNETRTIKGTLVLEIRQKVPQVPVPPGPRVELIDGTVLACKEVSVARDRARLTLHSGAEVSALTNRVASIRLGESTPELDDKWNTLRNRENKNDLLVVKKDDVLDFVPGVAGELSDKISFLVDGDEIPVARERVYGMIYRKRNVTSGKIVCQVKLATGDVLQATKVAVTSGNVNLKLGGNIDLAIPLDQVAALDYSAGKVKYLSQMEPREKKIVPLLDLPREVEKDRSLLGTPITLAGRQYTKGLGIFPQTRLKYRLAGEYARFRAIAGIDDAAPKQKTQVLLQILGDGKVLFEAQIAPIDAPRNLDLDVTGVRDLEVFVDFGADQTNIADFLDLADAKLTK